MAACRIWEKRICTGGDGYTCNLRRRQQKAAESLTAESFFEEPWKNPPSEKHLFNDSAANDSAKNLPPTPPA
jgi:hypothetical protein